MLEGKATHDFAGADISKRFAAIAAQATVRGFDVNKIPALAVAKPGIPGAALMEDGSVVFSDLGSFKSGKPKHFDIMIGGHAWSGAFVGVFALKATSEGRIEKLAAGGFSQLICDGKPVLSLSAPTDVVLLRGQDGKYQALIKGDKNTHRLTLP